MGGEFSSTSFSVYQLEKRVDIPAGLSLQRTCWELHDAVSTVDQAELSVFVYSAVPDDHSTSNKNWQRFGGNNAKVC